MAELETGPETSQDTGAAALAEATRGGLVENRHRGHAVILSGAGELLESWGNPEAVIFPRSSC